MAQRSTSSLPVYQQVANALEHQIEQGRLRPGDRLMSQRDLCDAFGISSVTAKRAIRRLRERGMIATRAGSRAVVSLADVGMRQGRIRRGHVGLLMFNIAPQPVYQYELECIAQAMQRQGMPVMMGLASDAAEVGRVVDQQRQAGVSCLMFFPRHSGWKRDEQTIRQLHAIGMPLLILESTHESESYIAADVAGGIRLAVEHLHALGHRRICLVSAYDLKIRAFGEATGRLGGITPMLIENSESDQLSMMRAAQQVLSMPRRPSAVIASTDRQAEVLVAHCLQAGVRVPQEMSIVGFDDTPPGSANSPVALTSVRHPVDAIAREAARWAQVRIQRQHATGRKLRRLIPFTLIRRQSTGPAAR